MADTITTWTPISAPTDFRDDAVFDIDSKTKSIQVLVEQPIVAGENKSQFIKFQMGRYYDAIDLTAMQVNIVFLSPAKNRGISAAVNTEYSDDAIRFGWLVPYEACPEKGKLYFAVEFVGADYTLKTTAGCTDVLDSISDRDIVPEPVEQEWYIVLQANVATLMQEAQSALGRVEGIFNALGTPLSAGTAAEMTEESAIYVYTGSEPNYEYGYWYYHDGTEWQPGGAYASTALYTDQTPTQGSTNAVSSGGVYSALQNKADKDSTPETVTPTETDADFYLSDENGNVLLELAEGHIKTKNFNSAAISSDTEAHGSNADDVDLDFADSQGHVLMRIKDGHIQTAGFDSSAIDGTPDFETYTSDTVTAISGTGMTLTVVHNFKKGDRIACHINDGVAHDNYGNYASWYEGSTLIASRRRGNNGYFERTVKADCASISVVIGADEYTAGTSLQLVVYILHRPVEPKIVTVAQDGTGMYTLLKDAVESITDANHVTNPYVIEVYPGTYDTLEGYDDETIAEAGTSVISGSVFQGLKLMDGTSIRGVGGNREEIILTATLDPNTWSSAVRSMISTLNIQGSGGIENLTIDAHYLRYCVHDDFTTPANERRLRTLKNVKFTGDHLSYTPHMTTYGAGCGYPRDYIIDNCDFGYGIGIHTQGGFKNGHTVLMNNCIGHNFRIGDTASADSDAVNDVIVNNCEFDVIQIAHANVLTVPHIRLMGTGNEKSIIMCLPTDIYQINTVKTITGYTVGQAVGKTSGSAAYGAYQVVTSIPLIYGIVVFVDSDFSYIQRTGYIASNVLGLTGLSMGDYVTIDSGGNVVTGGTSANAIGVVKWVDADGYAYIKLMI